MVLVLHTFLHLYVPPAFQALICSMWTRLISYKFFLKHSDAITMCLVPPHPIKEKLAQKLFGTITFGAWTLKYTSEKAEQPTSDY